jgi:hypothetical protein
MSDCQRLPRPLVAPASSGAAPENLVARVFVPDRRIEFAMVQPSSHPSDVPVDFDCSGVLLPAPLPTELAPSAGSPAAGRRVRVRTHAIGRAVALEVTGRLGDVVQDLDRAIELALADGPRGVVCDLSAVPDGADPGAVQVLAAAGRHVRDWPAIPVAVACPDPRVRAALRVHPLGGNLIVAESMLPAVSAVLVTPVPALEWLRLAPRPTAPRASRGFVTGTLQGWGLDELIPSACLVVSELVTNSTIHAGTDIEVSLARSLGVLRLTVRDHSPDLPHHLHGRLGLHGRGLTIVAGCSHAFGVLPTTEGGKVVWAVLNAAWPKPPTSNGMHRLTPVLDKQLGHD